MWSSGVIRWRTRVQAVQTELPKARSFYELNIKVDLQRATKRLESSKINIRF